MNLTKVNAMNESYISISAGLGLLEMTSTKEVGYGD